MRMMKIQHLLSALLLFSALECHSGLHDEMVA